MAQWTKPTPRLAWHGNMRRVTWMRNWPPYKTTCSILAQISAGPDMEKDAQAEYQPLRMSEAQVARLEAEIDVMNDALEPLRSFILPGGSALAAQLHLCRTVSRRAERMTVELAGQEAINASALQYLNRLSDWFFVAGRIANDDGRADILWVPGANR